MMTEALARKTVTVTPLVERVYPLAEGTDVVAHAGRTGVLKVLMRC